MDDNDTTTTMHAGGVLCSVCVGRRSLLARWRGSSCVCVCVCVCFVEDSEDFLITHSLIHPAVTVILTLISSHPLNHSPLTVDVSRSIEEPM